MVTIVTMVTTLTMVTMVTMVTVVTMVAMMLTLSVVAVRLHGVHKVCVYVQRTCRFQPGTATMFCHTSYRR